MLKAVKHTKTSRRVKPALGNTSEFLDAIKAYKDLLDTVKVPKYDRQNHMRLRPLYNRLLAKKRVGRDIRRSTALYYGSLAA